MPVIYLDHAASTRPDDEVIDAMVEVMRTAWANPSSQHPQGAAARTVLATARARVLAALGDRAEGGVGDLLWTSGCSESDAIAVLGTMRQRPGALVLSAIEHAAVSAPAAELAALGRTVVQVAPGADGILEPEVVAEAAAVNGAAIVAVVMVQNEVGLVQPVSAIASAVRKRCPQCHIHVDAAQAFGKVPLAVTTLGADSVALAAHKLAGPKGVGALWLRHGVALSPLWAGGGQQGGMRGGTQDAPAAAGFGIAAERAARDLSVMRARWLELASTITTTLDARGVAYRQLVPDQRRSPHILALAFAGVPASALRTVLASRGVSISTGSACAERDTKKSVMLELLGLAPDAGMCRLSFGRDTTQFDVTIAAGLLADVVGELARPAVGPTTGTGPATVPATGPQTRG